MITPKALRVDRNDRWRTPRFHAAKRAQDATIGIAAPTEVPPPVQSTSGLEAMIAANKWTPAMAITEKAMLDYMDAAMRWKNNSPNVWYGTPPESYAPPPPAPDDPLEFWADGTLLRWSYDGDANPEFWIEFDWPVEFLGGEIGCVHLRTGISLVDLVWTPGDFIASRETRLIER